MIRRLLLLSFCFGYSILLYAQPVETPDSAACAQKEIKVFVIRKPELQSVAATLPVSENKEANQPEVTENVNRAPYNIAMPSLASDEKGLLHLMQLEPYHEGRKPPQDAIYVVFSFSINELGAVSDITLYDANDRRLVDVLVYKLDKTRWNPAVGVEGEKTSYKFGKWIAIIPSKANDRDYEEHRY